MAPHGNPHRPTCEQDLIRHDNEPFRKLRQTGRVLVLCNAESTSFTRAKRPQVCLARSADFVLNLDTWPRGQLATKDRHINKSATTSPLNPHRVKPTAK
ncbi:hypothetical protein AAFF_G00024690 [Aldrovandia affinis]|uniref:Uncharacterized protein n=1 Tax=Aldrovandia affinis TaxID=143900 RepID=A0AAD7T5X6_9TELE|nr:hypothetical protein AAFF_G00024690 [Aldrovandia affinis]